jgi:hypothetical protein
VLKADVRTQSLPLAERFDLKRGDDVLTLGYPSPQLQGVEQKATFGKVNAVSGVAGDHRLAQVDVPIQPGNSGGPLLDKRGAVVGIVTMRLEGKFQNVGYVVKSDYLWPLLSSVSISPATPSLFSILPLYSTSQLAEQSQNAVVMVLGYLEAKLERSVAPQKTDTKNTTEQKKEDNAEFLKTKEAAERGEAWAQVNLGIMYAEGQGVPKDERKAVEWYQKAAEQGVAQAQAILGVMYLDGNGVIKDRRKGCDLLRKAGEQWIKLAIELYNMECAK